MSGLPEVTDLVVAGSGAAGFAAAITARRAGLDVLLLEKQPELGGTTARSGTWIWIPNNRLMRDSGLVDGRDDALRYMARLVRPDSYVADHPRLGLPRDEYEMLAAFYDHAAPALDELAAAGAIDPVLRSDAPDYFAELPENKAPYGRVVVSRGRERPDQLTGRELIADFAAAAGRLGVRIETGVAVTDVFGTAGRVEGVVCDERRIVARRGVVFATGGFAHSQKLMTRFVPLPVHATGAAAGSEGDFLRIGMRLGAQLRNMAEAWLAPVPIERYVDDPGTFTTNIFALRGDSMILVDRDGRRVVNEKLPYHELASAFLRWDPSTATYPNLRLFMVFDEHTRRLYADGKSGNPLPLDGERADHVVRGETIGELSARLSERLATSTREISADLRLAAGFSESLEVTIDRFNAAAAAGADPDFGRGSSAIELFRNGPARAGNAQNAALYPFDSQGPYYAIILAPASLDTKGGPATDSFGQVIGASGEAIPGLYAAGNCAGFPSGRSYWAGGATIGIAVTFGWRAALHAASSAAGPELARRGYRSSMSIDGRRSVVVFGARNLGRAVIELLTAEGSQVVGVARSAETLAGIASAGGQPLAGDITDRASVHQALEQAASMHGRVDLVVNAAAPYGGDRSGPFGGGPLSEATADAFEPWAAAPARAAFTFLSTTGSFLLAQGGPATVIQVTGGSARRAMAGRGLWAAGSFGVRALTNAAALELREHGIHVALLIVDAGIEPLDGAAPGRPIEALADPRAVAEAVEFLAEQGARSATHELQVTPLAERWVP